MAELEDLDRLAPGVDTDAALEQFRRRRTGRSLPRWPVLVAAAVLAVVAVVGASILAAGDDEPVATGPGAEVTDTAEHVDFTVRAVFESTEAIGTLRAAATPEEYDALLPDRVGPLASIDFDTEVVVSITIARFACAPDLTAFERVGDTITPVFRQIQGLCAEPHIPTTHLVSLPREQFEGSFDVHLPADETYGLGEPRRLSVRLEKRSTPPTAVEDPPVATPRCADIERFADQLVDVGIDHDYSASQSPADLLEVSDLVFLGRLTGGFADSTNTSGSTGRVGYELEIDALYKGPAEANLAPVQTIFVNVGDVDASDFEAAATRGIRVIVFAEYLRLSLGLPTAGIEGFVTGCPGGPLLGFTGSQGEWAEVSDLDDLDSRLELLPADG